MPVLSTIPFREALLGDGPTMEDELKAHFCLAQTSLCLDVPSSDCDFSGKLSKSLQGRDAEMSLLLGRAGALHSFCSVSPGVIP